LDNLTHSLLGLTLARTPLGRVGRGATAVLVLASNAPDIDIVTTVAGAANYMEWHRGPTHGPLGILGLGILTATLVKLRLGIWDRHRSDAHASWRSLTGIAIVGVFCHVMLDFPTSYGVRALSPFDWTWLTTDWMPIIDVYLIVTLAAGLWLSSRYGSRWAVVALALMIGNYGLRAATHHAAIATAPRVFGADLPARCGDVGERERLVSRWPRAGVPSPRDQSARHCLMEVAAIPGFASPFHWILVADVSNGYEIARVNLLSSRSRDARGSDKRYGRQWTPAVMQAANAPVARTFLAFSRLPAVRSVVDPDGTVHVEWTDIRFGVDGPEGARRGALFGASVDVAADGSIRRERLGS
jgi:membrane-bound metal-dependent hydrolase YbcI (DUF457 family)